MSLRGTVFCDDVNCVFNRFFDRKRECKLDYNTRFVRCIYSGNKIDGLKIEMLEK